MSENTTASPLRVTHDPHLEASYIYLAGPIPSGGVSFTHPVGRNINLDFDVEGRLLGIEVLRDQLMHPATIAAAELHPEPEHAYACARTLPRCPEPAINPAMKGYPTAEHHIYNLGDLSYGHLIVLQWALEALMRVEPRPDECLTFKDSQDGLYRPERIDLMRRLEEISKWHMKHIADPGG